MSLIGTVVALFFAALLLSFYGVVATAVWLWISDYLWPEMGESKRTTVGFAVVPTSFVALLALTAMLSA